VVKTFSDEDKLNEVQVEEVVKSHLERFKNSIIYLNRDNLYNELQYTVSELGYIDQPGYTQSILSYNDFIKCFEKIWEYVLVGVLAPGERGQNDLMNSLHTTDYGKKIIEADVNPYYEEKYIKNISELNTEIVDDISELYLREALKSFRFNCFLGSMVLLGGFSEKVFLNFLDKFNKCIQDQNNREEFKKKVEKGFIFSKFNAFIEFLEPSIKKIPKEITHNLNLWLNSFFNHIREVRNEIGHPTGRKINQQEVYSYLLVFPTYILNLKKLLDYFKSNLI